MAGWLRRFRFGKKAGSGATKGDARLLADIKDVAGDWVEAPYYALAERSIDGQWANVIYPFIKDCDFREVVDLAAGHGRNTAKLLDHARKVWIFDVNQTNISFCKERFAGEARVAYVLCDGASFRPLPDNSVSLVYSFDAMVHFHSDVIREYLRDAFRVLEKGGRVFFHHSDTSTNPTGSFRDSPGWRNFMTVELMAHWAAKEGFTVVRQRRLDWGPDGTVKDGFTLLAKPRR